jgi:hypothetical protein
MVDFDIIPLKPLTFQLIILRLFSFLFLGKDSPGCNPTITINNFQDNIKLNKEGMDTMGFTINQKNKNNTSAINK